MEVLREISLASTRTLLRTHEYAYVLSIGTDEFHINF